MIDVINKRKLLKELMSYDFILNELNLYLNSHPTDKQALKMHEETKKKAKCAWDKYEIMYGALTANNSNSPDNWDWLCGPWPWEND